MTHKLLVAILCLLAVALQSRLWIGEGSLAHVAALAERVEAAELANEVRRQRNAVRAIEITALKQGNDALEARARSELGMIRTGETLFLLVDDS